MSAVLTLKDLTVALPRGADRPEALRQVSLELKAGEILCVVGESGSGKSMMASAVMRLLPGNVRITCGTIQFEGKDLASADEATMRTLRGARIAMVFQEPMTALNPLRSIGDQIAEMFRIHTSLSTTEIEARVLALLEEVRIPHPAEAARAFPHELSGGQRQRAMIAMALALDPVVLGCHHPGANPGADPRFAAPQGHGSAVHHA
jgi:peptide/nickel transport system ATP-binding protein